MTAIADTGALYAIFDGDDAHHDEVIEWLNTATDTLLVSPLVLPELDYLLARRGGEAKRAAAMSELSQRVAVASFTHTTFVATADVAAQQGKIGIGLTDASIMVLAHQHHTLDLFTVDQRHFRAVRPIVNRRKRFRLLPADA